MEIPIFHTTLYQRVPTVEAGLHHQVKKLIHSRQGSLIPQISQGLLNGFLSHAARTQTEVMHRFNNTDLCWLLQLPKRSPAQIRTGNHVHNMAQFPREPARRLVAVTSYWGPSHEGSAISPHQNRNTLDLDMPSLAEAGLSSLNLLNGFVITNLLLLYSTASHKKKIYFSSMSEVIDLCPWHLSFLPLYPLCRNRRPSRKLRWSVKNSLWHQLRDNPVHSCEAIIKYSSQQRTLSLTAKCKGGEGSHEGRSSIFTDIPITNFQNLSSHLHQFGVCWF